MLLVSRCMARLVNLYTEDTRGDEAEIALCVRAGGNRRGEGVLFRYIGVLVM